MDRPQLENKIFWLRHDDEFDDLLVEALRRSATLNKLVVNNKVDVEKLREFALRAIEAALVRFADCEMSLLDDGRYSEQIGKAIERIGIGPAHREQQEMFRAAFRFVHAALRDTNDEHVAYRMFGLATYQLVEILGKFHAELLPVILQEEEEEC